MVLKSLALYIPQIRRLYDQRNALLARVAGLEERLRTADARSAIQEEDGFKAITSQLDQMLTVLQQSKALHDSENQRLEEARAAALEGALREQGEKFSEAVARLGDEMQARGARDEAKFAALVEGQHRLEEMRRDIMSAFAHIENRFNGVEHALQHHTHQLEESGTFASMHFPVRMTQVELQMRDLVDMQLASHPVPALGWKIVAERGIAADTNDHLFPRGTRNDNTRHPRFVTSCETLLGSSIKHLDLGCAGGGLIWDFTRRGHASVGVEGSDYSMRMQRAEWRTIPDRLFTADICYPFHFEDRDGERVRFDIISAWELFEHIPEAQLAGLLKNITSNLRPQGYIAASIATFVDKDEATGTIYHHTVQPREWWEARFESVGLVPLEGIFETADFVRGSGNPTAYDWDVRANPELGFHIVLRYEP